MIQSGFFKKWHKLGTSHMPSTDNSCIIFPVLGMGQIYILAFCASTLWRNHCFWLADGWLQASEKCRTH